MHGPQLMVRLAFHDRSRVSLHHVFEEYRAFVPPAGDAKSILLLRVIAGLDHIVAALRWAFFLDEDFVVMSAAG